MAENIDVDDKILKYLKNKWGKTKCPMCRKSKWELPKPIFAIYGFKNYSILPIIPIVCPNCGLTVFVSAIKAGIVNCEGELNG